MFTDMSKANCVAIIANYILFGAYGHSVTCECPRIAYIYIYIYTHIYDNMCLIYDTCCKATFVASVASGHYRGHMVTDR